MGDTLSTCVQDDADGDGLSSAISEISDELSSAVAACVTGDGPDFDDVDERGDFMTLPQDDERKNREVALENTLNRLGVPVREFYQVPHCLDKPVGSRVLPDFASKRSGVVYAPGAVIEVIQEVTMDGVRYLRTDDKKGWLFAFHPKLEMTMLEPAPGNYIIENSTFRCVSHGEEVPIREGPGLMSKCRDDAVFPGEEVHTVARWLPDDGTGLVFLKLSDHKGWVELFKTGSNKIYLFSPI